MLSFLDSNQLARAFIQALPDALVVVDSAGTVVAVNAHGLELLGYTEAELLGQPVEVLVPSRLREAHQLARTAFGNSPSRRPMAQGSELTARRRDGSEISVQIALGPLATGSGPLVLVVMRETPDHVRALRAAEARYRSAIEMAPDAVFVADLQGRYVEVNTAACRMLGYSREQLLTKTIMDLLPPEDAPRLAAARSRLLTPGQVQVSEWSLLRADGSRLLVEMSAVIHPDGRWQAFARDVSERRQAAEAVERTLHELEMVLERLPDPVAIRIGDEFAYVNSAWVRVLGYDSASELLGRPILESVHPDDRKMVTERMQQIDQAGRSSATELRLLAKDGSVVALEVPESIRLLYRGQPAALVVAHDGRERKRLESALALGDRLVTVGTLAAGVGHEINNPLQYVSMNLELLRDELHSISGGSPSGRFQALLELTADALRGAERIGKIVAGLHTFARGEREELVELDLAPVLELSFNLTRNELRHRLQLETQFADTPRILADESRLAQVFINLLMNAAQAMAERPAEQNVLRVSTWTDERGRAVVEIRDNGPGMPDAVRSRIFEPFFTTKPIGQGTGLGLSIAYNIVTGLGGQLECESEPGVGAAFRVVLPASSRSPRSVSGIRKLEPPVRRARILVVEDEPVVASLLERVLKSDHDIDMATDGLEALALLESGREYDVILCDLMMPHLTGQALYTRATQRWPRVAPHFVFMTGGTTSAAAEAFLAAIPNEKLYKPFSVPSLHSVVGRVLKPQSLASTGSGG